MRNRTLAAHAARTHRALQYRYRSLFRAVVRTQGVVCQGCASPRTLELAYRTPPSQGGTNAPHNLQLLCQACAKQGRETVPVHAHVVQMGEGA